MILMMTLKKGLVMALERGLMKRISIKMAVKMKVRIMMKMPVTAMVTAWNHMKKLSQKEMMSPPPNKNARNPYQSQHTHPILIQILVQILITLLLHLHLLTMMGKLVPMITFQTFSMLLPAHGILTKPTIFVM